MLGIGDWQTLFEVKQMETWLLCFATPNCQISECFTLGYILLADLGLSRQFSFFKK